MSQDRLEKIETTTLHERAYQQLKAALMSGAFHPGEAVTMRGVATALGTSVMPVREAVRRLVSERALEMPTSRSIRVPPMSREHFINLCRTRSLLEGEAAARAAVRAQPADISKLEKLNARFVSNASAGEIKNSLVRNREFHFTIYQLADDPLLLSIIETLWLQGGPYLNLLVDALRGDREQLNAAVGSHSDLLTALKAANAERARRAMQSDITDSAKLYLKEFDRVGESNVQAPMRKRRSVA